MRQKVLKRTDWQAILRTARMSAICGSCILAVSSYALNNGVARTPPMGWNDWNQFMVINRSLITVVGDSLISTGLKDLGYVYVNRDGGNPRPRSADFVSTWKPISDTLHAKGLKFGCYLDSTDDAAATVALLEDAGVDFIKFDGWVFQNCDHQYLEMRDALLASSRPIVYSTNTCQDSNVCNMWRTGRDIDPNWQAVMECFDPGAMWTWANGPGHWPDPDFLEVGVSTDDGHLTDTENRAHFTMWAILPAPLITGFDLTNTRIQLSQQDYARIIEIHGNAEVIAVNQDPLGLGAGRVRGAGSLEVWVKALQDGTKAVALFNRTGADADISISQNDLGWGSAGQIFVRDLWTHEDVQPFTGNFTKRIASHGAEMYRMHTSAIEWPVDIMRKMDKTISWLKKNGRDPFSVRMVPHIIQGNIDHTRAYDLRGRMYGLNPALAGSGMLIIRPAESAKNSVFMWMRSQAAAAQH